MAERIIPVRGYRKPNEVVQRAYVASSTSRSKSSTAAYLIRVGIAQGSEVEWLGEWSQKVYALSANERHNLTGESDLNIPLDEGDMVVVGITKTGSPASLDGMSVEVEGELVGEVGPQNMAREDGTFTPAASITEQLFSVAGQIPDPTTRHSVESLATTLNESGVTGWTKTLALTDEVVVATAAPVATYHDYDASDQTINSTSYVDGNVSIEVTVPAGYTSVHVIITGAATIDPNVSAGYGFLALSDGSSEVVEAESQHAGNNYFKALSVHYAEEITADTTYKLRFKYATAAIDAKFQEISALAIAVA